MDCWRDELEKAKTEEDVVRSASDYLTLWAPTGLDAMELGLVEMRIESGDDIERVRRSLRRPDSLASAESRDVAHLQEIASYFSEAASRVNEIRAG